MYQIILVRKIPLRILDQELFRIRSRSAFMEESENQKCVDAREYFLTKLTLETVISETGLQENICYVVNIFMPRRVHW